MDLDQHRARRKLRLQELLMEKIGGMLNEMLDLDSGVLVTIVRVEVSSDSQHAKVFFGVYPASFSDVVLSDLHEIVPKIQQKLNKIIKRRPVPRINFTFDITSKNVEDLHKTLKDD